MKIDLKILTQAIKDVTSLRVRYEGESQISINDVQITIIENIARYSRTTSRFGNLKVLLGDLHNARILPADRDINQIVKQYTELENESKALLELIAKYHG